MSRRLRVATKELGLLELLVIYENGGTWEQPWESLREEAISSLFTKLSVEDYNHALLGWTKPLITSLGLAPNGALRKLPTKARQCEVRERCPFYDKKTCQPASVNLPWCYDADVSDDGQKRHLTSEVIRFWREGVYVVVVRETP